MQRKGSAVFAVLITMVSVAPLTVHGSALLSRSATVDPRAVGDEISRAASWAQRDRAASYAGVWLGRGVVHIGFTHVDQELQADLSRVASGPAGVMAVPVARSWRELIALQSRIDRDTTELRARGVEITSTSIRPQDDKVMVGVRTLTGPIYDVITARYGRAGVEVTKTGPFRTLDRTVTTPPWQGGIELLGVCQGTSTDCIAANCTANFSMFDFIQNVQFGYKLTAGHCYEPNTHVTNGTGVALGPVLQSFYASGSNADMEDILIPTSTLTDRIITNDPATQPVITYDNQQATGIGVCKSGISTNETCSWTVTAIHATIDVCEDPNCTIIVTLLDQVEVSSPTPALADGDSGGPVYRYVSGGVEAEGIVSTGNDTNTIMTYSFILDEINTLNKFLCVAPTC